MKFEMTKETEGQRGQEVQDRQLVKGGGGRIWNREELNVFFPISVLKETYIAEAQKGRRRKVRTEGGREGKMGELR